MTTKEPDPRQQQRNAYVLLAGGIVILAGAIGLVVAELASAPLLFGALLPAAVLLFVGYRGYAPSKQGDVRRGGGGPSPYLLAGSQSFWVLVVVVMADGAFDLIPDDQVSAVLLWIAILVFGSFTVYYRYFPPGSTTNGTRPARGNA